jgi:aldehyde:ferredoxin oxidoreductase
MEGKRLPLDRERVGAMLRKYFALHGWDDEGKLKEDTIERLGIEIWKN